MSAAFSQTSLRVQVNDPTGRAVPNASITLTSPPAPPKSGRTDVQGQYLFRNLEPGDYRVSIAAKGFAPFDLQHYDIAPGRAQSLITPLVLATTTEKITVADSARID